MEEDVEQLLKRIEALEDAHDSLKQKLCNSTNFFNLTQEAQYLNILHSIDAPIHIVDVKGFIIYRNPAWEKVHGYSVGESVGKQLIDLIIGPKDIAIAHNIFSQIILKGAIHGGEFVLRNKKGQRFISFSCSTPLRDQTGAIIGMVGASIIRIPFPELTHEPQVAPPATSDHMTHMSPKANGISSPWKNGPARSCWHWLYHTDQEHEYILKMLSCIPRQLNTVTLCQSSSSFEKVYEIRWEDLVIRERIGTGSYGILYHAVWYGSDVAVKLFPKQQYYSHDLILSFRQEISMMKRLRHPNILLFMGVVISPHQMCIVTEFLCRGSLFQLLHRRRVRFNLKHHVHMALDIARGMNYLHCCLPPLIHCDLKSSNLRVDKNWTVKIGDFGLCRPKHETKEGIGSPEWMAPEVLRNEDADEKSDVYSYGVVLWEMTTEKIPWEMTTEKIPTVIEGVGFMNQRLDIPKDVDPQWASLIERCLCSEPNSRPTFKQILDDLKELQKNISLQLHNNHHKC